MNSKIILGIPIQKNVLNENVIQNVIIKYYGKNVIKPSNPLNLNFSRNITSKNLNKNQCCSIQYNGIANKLLLPVSNYSTQSQYLINGRKKSKDKENPVEDKNLSNNISVNHICFSTYNKRFISSFNKINGANNNLDFKGCCMTYSTETDTINNNSNNTNDNVKDTTAHEEPSKDYQNQKDRQDKTKKEKFTFASLIKEYGIIAIVVYFVLSSTIYLTTLGVILYYDIDPDELTKKSKTYITKMVKRILGKVETIEENIEEVKAKMNEKKKHQEGNQDQEQSLIPVIETDEDGKPVEKKKRGFIKTMIMTFAVAQIFSPPKSLMTIIITPYIAKILKRGGL